MLGLQWHQLGSIARTTRPRATSTSRCKADFAIINTTVSLSASSISREVDQHQLRSRCNHAGHVQVSRLGHRSSSPYSTQDNSSKTITEWRGSNKQLVSADGVPPSRWGGGGRRPEAEGGQSPGESEAGSRLTFVNNPASSVKAHPAPCSFYAA